MTRTCSALLLTALVLSVIWPSGSAPAAGGAARAAVARLTVDGREAWIAPLDLTAEASPEPVELFAAQWRPSLPEIEIALEDGGTFSLAAARGRVVILDFWATWCVPCADELRALDGLYEAEKERGLDALAINVRESPEAIAEFAEALGLQIPIARYDNALEREFRVRSLPTLLIADRNGKIRQRWDGYRLGLEDEIAERVRILLDGTDEEDAREPLARVVRGEELLRIRWTRRLSGEIDALAWQDPSLVATAGRTLFVLGRDGALVRRMKGPRVAALRHGDLDGDGGAELLGYRPGSVRLSRLDTEEGEHRTWDAPGPVLDLELLPADGRGGRGGLVLVTPDGVLGTDPDGEKARAFEDLGRARDVTLVETASSSLLAVLDDDGGVRWVDPRGRRSKNPERFDTGRHRPVAAHAAGDGLLLLPVGTVAAAVGRFLDGERSQLALATVSGQVVLLDGETGAELLRADWPGVRALAAGDLDGDGIDELAVGSGRWLCVLESVS